MDFALPLPSPSEAHRGFGLSRIRPRFGGEIDNLAGSPDEALDYVGRLRFAALFINKRSPLFSFARQLNSDIDFSKVT